MRFLSLSAVLAMVAAPVLGFSTQPEFRRKSTDLKMVVGGPILQKAAVKAGAVAVGAAALAGTGIIKLVLDKPSRTYGAGTVAEEYDEWTEEGILEYYWGEHIHLGYYSKDEKYRYKPLKDAQYTFIDEMMKFGGIDPATDKKSKVLDVGCGFGGTSRYLARALGPDSEVTAITLSPKQVERATELAIEQNTPNTKFMVEDALAMSFPDNSFDIVWACESGEHMPDKKKYIEQMMRVLKPGGKFVMATWCQRDDREVALEKRDKRDLQYLYEEWSHPYFISKEAYKELIEETGVMNEVTTADWVKETIATWRHTIFKGIKDPRGWIFKPKTYVKCVRDAYCLERMHRAFKRGLMEYGMLTATKKK
jgi:MPBQ/MSBQ methyltransferase